MPTRWKNRTSRRAFLQSSLSGLGALQALHMPNLLLGQAPRKLQFGGIGVGGKGKTDIARAAEGCEIVALCDVDRRQLEAAKVLYPNARVFEDFREMFATMGDRLDGVTVSTPDHSHYPIAMEAIRHGKHVCVQKPLVNRIWEANQLLEAARKKKVLTNMGNQGHLTEGIRLLKEWIAAGAVGRVREIVVWTNRPIWPQGTRAAGTIVPADPVPPTLNWEGWLAQCPSQPYLAGLHPFAWRAHAEFGAGAMGDMGCHLLDGPFWACELGEPIRLEAKVNEASGVSFPAQSTIECVFRSALFGEVKLVWMDGGLKPERPVELDHPDLDWEKMKGGCLYRGDEGLLLCPGDNSANPRILNAARHRAFLETKNPKPTLERATVTTPQLELVQAIEQQRVCGANFEYAVPLTRVCLLGNIAALLPGTSLEWDAQVQQFKSNPAADALMKRSRTREGWDYRAERV